MYVIQEVWYITTGTYRVRKSLYVVYNLNPQTRERENLIVLDKNNDYAKLQALYNSGALELIGLEVTPKQFKFFEKKQREQLS